jgi:hypothetical protein
MDKVMKAEIREIVRLAIKTKEQELATNALTSLIIKWLESKIVTVDKTSHDIALIDTSRNQLITELIGEVR